MKVGDSVLWGDRMVRIHDVDIEDYFIVTFVTSLFGNITKCFTTVHRKFLKELNEDVRSTGNKSPERLPWTM
jgi:hypothetical protein